MLGVLRNHYGKLQTGAVLCWLGLEVAGYGFGVLDGVMGRRLTNATPSRGIGSLLSSAPPGPIRLTRAERADVEKRLKDAFGDAAPKLARLSDLRWMYQLKSGSLCDWRGANVASDGKDCNQLERTTPLFQALLEAMHPKTEHLLWTDVTGWKGDTVTVAFFVGKSGKPRVIFDLSRIDASQWDASKGFVLKAYHGNTLTELKLGEPLSHGQNLFLIDDPGDLTPLLRKCGDQPCPATLLLYGHDHKGYRNGEGKLAAQILADIKLAGDLAKRFTAYAALTSNGASKVAALPQEPFKVTRFSVIREHTIHIERKLDAMFGAGAAARAVYGPFGYRAAFASVYAIVLDGAHYALWDGGTPYPSLGTDRFVFDRITGGSVKRLDGIKSANGVYALPYSPADGDVRFEVRKFIDQGGQPWSDFADLKTLFAPLLALR